MYQYSFKSSIFCTKLIQANPQTQAFQHQLPPDSQIPKSARQKQIQPSQKHPKQHPQQQPNPKIQQIINTKNQQIQLLLLKNTQLLNLLSIKQSQKAKMTKKYNQLLLMYQQIKNNGVTKGMQTKLQLFAQDNFSLKEQVVRLENELMQSQRQIIKKIKYYQDKNQESRRLLEKLNQNIIKKQEKLNKQLNQLSKQLNNRNQQIYRLQEQNRNLLNSNNDKQDQITRILAQTQRDRSAYQQNISSVQLKLQIQNNKLHEQLKSLKQQQTHSNIASTRKYSQLQQIKNTLQQKYRNQCTILSKQLQDSYMQFQDVSARLEDTTSKLNNIQIKYQQLIGYARVLQADKSQLENRINGKIQELNKQKIFNKQLQIQLDKTRKQAIEKQNTYKLALENIKIKQQALNSYKQELDKCKQLLMDKISYIAELQVNLEETKKLVEANNQVVQELSKANRDYLGQIKNNGKVIRDLQDLLESFKSERVRVRSEFQVQWKQMTVFYELQIQKLQNKIIGFQNGNHHNHNSINSRSNHNSNANNQNNQNSPNLPQNRTKTKSVTYTSTSDRNNVDFQ